MSLYFKKIAFATVTAGVLTGCSTVNSALADRSEIVEIYHIFDIKTGASPDEIIKATSKGLRSNINGIQEHRPMQLNKSIPDVPEKFEIVDISDAFQGSPLGGILQMANPGSGLKNVVCKNAVWTGKAIRKIYGYNDLSLTACIYRYKKGYQLDMYAISRKNSGGIMGGITAATDAIVGTPEEWTNKTFVDTVRAIESDAGGKITHVEGQPEIGNLPWTDFGG